MSLVLYRIGNYLHGKNVPLAPRVCTVLGQILFGAYVPATCSIGKGTKLAYGGAGVVIHASASLGRNCLISPGVVIGGRSRPGAVPTIGNGVRLFPGAKILGKVTIGDGANIGANAVVIADVPAGATVVAPLARVLDGSAGS